jgi:hypothetical protein
MRKDQKNEGTLNWPISIFLKNFHAVSLILCAVAVILYEIVHIVRHSKIESEQLSFFIVNLLAVLAIVAGLERFIEFRHLDLRLDQISDKIQLAEASVQGLGRTLRSSLSVRLIEGYEQVYADAARLGVQAETSIKVLLMGTAAPAPESFAQELSLHLARHPFVNYDVIVAMSAPTDEFWTKIDARQQIYKARGVDNRVHLSIIKMSRPIGFDLMIVDEKHVHIAFPSIPAAGHKTEIALVFENEPAVAARLEAWFTRLPSLMKYDEARREYFARKGKSFAEGAGN